MTYNSLADMNFDLFTRDYFSSGKMPDMYLTSVANTF